MLAPRRSLYLWEGLRLQMLSMQHSLDCRSATSVNQGAIWSPWDLNMQTIRCVVNSDWYAVLHWIPESAIKTLSIAEQNWANNGFFFFCLTAETKGKSEEIKKNESLWNSFFFFRGTLSNTTLGKKNVRNTWLKRILFKHLIFMNLTLKCRLKVKSCKVLSWKCIKLLEFPVVRLKLAGVLHINKWHFYR